MSSTSDESCWPIKSCLSSSSWLLALPKYEETECDDASEEEEDGVLAVAGAVGGDGGVAGALNFKPTPVAVAVLLVWPRFVCSLLFV